MKTEDDEVHEELLEIKNLIDERRQMKAKLHTPRSSEDENMPWPNVSS